MNDNKIYKSILLNWLSASDEMVSLDELGNLIKTRTKIQLGGLLMKSAITDLLDIKSGDDLQLDLNKKDKAYILLGILADCCDNIKSQSSLSHFLSRGKTIANS